MKKIKEIILVGAILVLSLLVRLWKMEYLPFQYDADETGYILAGHSLLEVGKPISWTSFEYDYGKQRIYYNPQAVEALKSAGYQFTLFYPWFDHPPLLPLIEGSWFELLGYKFPTLYPSLITRIPMLFFSGVTLFFIFLITRELFGFKSGILALILAGFSPSLVLIQRMVVGENVYIPIMLAALYLTLKNRPLLPIIFLSALAPMAKITGLIVIPITGYGLLVKKQYKKCLIYGISSFLIFISVYSLYGYLIDWPTFVQLLKTQSFRLLGWGSLVHIFSRPGFHTLVMPDATYYLFLFLGIGMLFTWKGEKHKFLTAAIFGSLILVWLTSSENDTVGWYKLPLFTFLIISSGRAFFQKSNFVLWILLTMTMINNVGLIRSSSHPYPLPLFLRLVVGGSFMLLLILGLLKEKLRMIFNRFILTILLIIYIGSAFYINHNYYASLCENIHCALPALTLRQAVEIVKSKI